MKQKGEFYKVKKSGFSMLLLLICVSMLSVMPVSAARKKSRKKLTGLTAFDSTCGRIR